MNENILSKIICTTYENDFRRKTDYNKAMHVGFYLEDNTQVELLLIWTGYVGVFERINKKEWKCLSCHDSCWRVDGVEHFISKYYEQIRRIEGLFSWFEKIDINKEMDNMFREIERNRFK